MADMSSNKRKPEHNPWYLLATLHGEAESTDDELHARNRMAWNRFMAAELSEDDRTLLIKERRCSTEELKPFSAEELSQVEKLFSERHREATGEDNPAGTILSLPNLKRDRIDFSNINFDCSFLAAGFLFPVQTSVKFGEPDFSGATFSGPTDFSGATFSGWAGFLGATFSRVIFRSATFFDQAAFWRTTFSEHADFQGAKFSGEADFMGATFSVAIFRGATFSGRADFRRTTFSDIADFRDATFSAQGEADFLGASFGLLANFPGASFSGWANFSGASFCCARFLGATFSGQANFSRAKFSDQADFSSVTFEKEALFVNAKMEGLTTFEDATFSTTPPRFFEAKLHEGTVWRDVNWPPPPMDSKEAGRFVDAYERLKLEMDRLRKYEDELNFFARELQSRRMMHRDWQPVSELRLFRRTVPLPLEIPEKTITLKLPKLFGRSFAPPTFTMKARTIRLFRPAPGLPLALYGWLSDYGRSYVRPLCGLLITVAAGIRFFWWHFGLFGYFQAVGLSFANTFGVLGFRKDLIDSHVITALPGWLKAIAAAQTIAGIVLLFLFGLAIRNRFRMK